MKPLSSNIVSEKKKMEFLVVDVQGFNTPYFTPKEICIYNARKQILHTIIKPHKKFTSLDEKIKKQVIFEEKRLHGIRYSSGISNLKEVTAIFRNILQDYAITRIYVKGENKAAFIKTLLHDINMEQENYPIIINLEHHQGVPNLKRTIPSCMFHDRLKNDSFSCAINNCLIIYSWLSKREGDTQQ